MSTLESRRVRLLLDTDKNDAPKDLRTGEIPNLWLRSDVRFEVGVRYLGEMADLANIASITLAVYADQTTGALKATVTTASLTSLITQAGWNDGTAENAVLELSNAQTDFDLGSATSADYWLSIYALTNDSPAKQIPLGAGAVRFRRGRLGEGGTAPAPTEDYYNRDESDARYVQRHAHAHAVARGTDGYDYAYSATTGKWHRLQLQSQDGVLSYVVEQTGVNDVP